MTTELSVEETDIEQPERLQPPRRRFDDNRIAYAVEALAALPVIAMLIEVARSPRLQMLDYWHVLLRITNPDGSLHLSGFRFLQNEHPLYLKYFSVECHDQLL